MTQNELEAEIIKLRQEEYIRDDYIRKLNHELRVKESKRDKLLVPGTMALQAILALCLILVALAGLTFFIHELIKAW